MPVLFYGRRYIGVAFGRLSLTLRLVGWTPVIEAAWDPPFGWWLEVSAHWKVRVWSPWWKLHRSEREDIIDGEIWIWTHWRWFKVMCFMTRRLPPVRPKPTRDLAAGLR